jgi:uncharacterized protein YndB with AHSA1/START domain
MSSKTKTLEITRIFDAPREKVWKAWTEPEHVMKWWGPKGFTSPSCSIDLRVGGKIHFCMHGPEGTEFDKDMWSLGILKEIIPMEKLVMSDHFADAEGAIVSPKEYGMPGQWPEEMTISVTLEDTEDGKTKMTLVHTGHPVEMADMAKQGWNESLDKLAESLEQ